MVGYSNMIFDFSGIAELKASTEDQQHCVLPFKLCNVNMGFNSKIMLPAPRGTHQVL